MGYSYESETRRSRSNVDTTTRRKQKSEGAFYNWFVPGSESVAFKKVTTARDTWSALKAYHEKKSDSFSKRVLLLKKMSDRAWRKWKFGQVYNVNRGSLQST